MWVHNSVHSVAYAIRGGLMMGYATKPINAILRGGQSLRLKSHPMARVDISPPSPTPNHIRRVFGKIHPALCADSQWLIICAKLLIALGTLWKWRWWERDVQSKMWHNSLVMKGMHWYIHRESNTRWQTTDMSWNAHAHIIMESMLPIVKCYC